MPTFFLSLAHLLSFDTGKTMGRSATYTHVEMYICVREATRCYEESSEMPQEGEGTQEYVHCILLPFFLGRGGGPSRRHVCKRSAKQES
jgi:hypothetical protein